MISKPNVNLGSKPSVAGSNVDAIGKLKQAAVKLEKIVTTVKKVQKATNKKKTPEIGLDKIGLSKLGGLGPGGGKGKSKGSGSSFGKGFGSFGNKGKGSSKGGGFSSFKPKGFGAR